MTNFKKQKIFLSGLTCVACQNIITEEGEQVSRVQSVKVDLKTQTAEVEYEGEEFPWTDFKAKIEALGYNLALEQSKLVPKKKTVTLEQWFYAVLLVLGLYLVYRYLAWIGLLNWLDFKPKDINFGAAFMIGIVASLSTCLAVVGGVVLSFAAKYQSRGNAWQRNVEPHLLFHVGRLVSFFVLGGTLGWLGSKISLSTGFFSWFTILVSLVLAWLALNILGLLPSLTKFGLGMPKSSFKVWQKLKNSEHKTAPLLLGAFTFFLPCGFTQSMQLFAISSGSFWQGAMTLFLFALGTAPVLFLVGSTTSRFKNLRSVVFEKAIGLLILFFALYTLTAGLNQYGFNLSAFSNVDNNDKQNNIQLTDGVQIIKMTEDNYGYSPTKFTIKKDVPVRWIIDAQSPYSCASSLLVPKLGIRKNLTLGENIIEFTPTETGKISFSCGMGMYNGVLTVE